ncbi:MAG: bifunctional phosphopantothenoylcysteine decarboxylase/phosphopantothenate--cysteine ligase CoaBC, partial [Chitinophagia bacterium]|nr:bifunctional phosphopantothenoylcysteine decarboxylase/phosphopantothenate--cysteine ligase CoaBC [Chitinophagia bacterium]
VYLAPAMDADMWIHPSTQHNVQRLVSYGNIIIPVAHGELASGLVGNGRMAEPEDMVHLLIEALQPATLPLAGQKALVTAGPTYERLDPVRFIGNFSTGKMGIAIADALAARGAEVTLVCGPTPVKATHSRVSTLKVESAAEMYAACVAAFPEVQVAVMAAAVADYRPAETAPEKIKKDGSEMHLALVKTTDILASLGAMKQPGQTLIGFALETENERQNAMGKLTRKNADAIVLNSLRDEGAGFGHDTNKVTVLTAGGDVHEWPLAEKTTIATNLADLIIQLQHV